MSDTTDAIGTSGTPTGSAETPPGAPRTLQMLQMPGLPEAYGDVPVCGPDGCTVPAPVGPVAPQRGQ